LGSKPSKELGNCPNDWKYLDGNRCMYNNKNKGVLNIPENTQYILDTSQLKTDIQKKKWRSANNIKWNNCDVLSDNSPIASSTDSKCFDNNNANGYVGKTCGFSAETYFTPAGDPIDGYCYYRQKDVSISAYCIPQYDNCNSQAYTFDNQRFWFRTGGKDRNLKLGIEFDNKFGAAYSIDINNPFDYTDKGDLIISNTIFPFYNKICIPAPFTDFFTKRADGNPLRAFSVSLEPNPEYIQVRLPVYKAGFIKNNNGIEDKTALFIMTQLMFDYLKRTDPNFVEEIKKDSNLELFNMYAFIIFSLPPSKFQNTNPANIKEIFVTPLPLRKRNEAFDLASQPPKSNLVLPEKYVPPTINLDGKNVSSGILGNSTGSGQGQTTPAPVSMSGRQGFTNMMNGMNGSVFTPSPMNQVSEFYNFKIQNNSDYFGSVYKSQRPLFGSLNLGLSVDKMNNKDFLAFGEVKGAKNIRGGLVGAAL